MNAILQRLRPTRATLAAAIGLLWAVSFGAVRDFVWADLREGMLRLDGHSRVTRGLVWLGFALLFGMVGALLFNDIWRLLFPLLPLTGSGAAGWAGRGALLPVALIPVTLFLFAVAWSFVLAGALHSHPAIRLLALLLYLLTALSWTGISASTIAPQPFAKELSLAALAIVPLFLLLRWRATPRPVLEFAVLLLLVSVTLALAQLQAVALWRATGTPVVLVQVQASVLAAETLVAPLLLLIGVDIANFARQAAGWSVAIIAERLPRWAPYLLLVLVAGWRLRVVLGELLDRLGESSIRAELLAYAGALGEVLCVGLVWWLVTRARRPRTGAGGGSGGRRGR